MRDFCRYAPANVYAHYGKCSCYNTCLQSHRDSHLNQFDCISHAYSHVIDRPKG